MSDEMLHDDELDAVAGGADVTLKAKVATTAYSTAVRSEKTQSTPPTVHTIDRTAGTQGLASLHFIPKVP